MRNKINEYDYLYLSARIRCLENRMLTRDRMERMLDARTDEDAAKVLSECGYGEFPSLTPAGIERTLDEARQALFDEFRTQVPDPSILDVFRIKYDYHNAKVLLKAQATGQDPSRLFIDAGRYPASQLQESLQQDRMDRYPAVFAEAVAHAADTLAASGDPQSADLVLDRAYYEEMLSAAQASKSQFLLGYVRLSIDAANLRSAVRSRRIGRGIDFMKQVLIPGGDVKLDRLAAAATGGGDLKALFARTPLEGAAEAGALALEGGPLTNFERLSDNALTAYLTRGRQVPFGEHPLIGYLYAKEAELTTIRILLTGRLAGLDADTIRERLRESYV